MNWTELHDVAIGLFYFLLMLGVGFIFGPIILLAALFRGGKKEE